MINKYNADLAKCLEELSKSITEFENLKCRLDEDVRWFNQRLEENTESVIADSEPLSQEERANIEQDMANATALKSFISNIANSVISHSIAISDKLLGKESA